jgi:hypothetical protein
LRRVNMGREAISSPMLSIYCNIMHESSGVKVNMFY